MNVGYIGTGAPACATVADIVAQSDVLFTCAPNNESIRQVSLGEGGVASTIRAGSITIDCSTVGPDAKRQVHAAIKKNGTSHDDASMPGSVKQAAEGTISCVADADVGTYERARDVPSVCGQMTGHSGPSGAGDHMKLIHQTLVAGHAVALAEATGLCLETGADIETFFDIVTQGTGSAYSRSFENRVPRMREGDLPARFMLKFLLKDIRQAGNMASDVEQNFPGLDATVKTFEDNVDQGWGDEDFPAVTKLVEARTGRAIAK